MAVAKKALQAFAAEATTLRLGLDTTQMQDKLAAAKVELFAVAKDAKNIPLGADTTKFWTEIAAIKTTLDSLHTVDINIDANTALAMAKIEALKGQLASLKTGGLLSPDIGGINTALGALGALDGGGGGGAGGTAAAAGGVWTLIHSMHLFTPEIVGFAAALVSVGAGFTALGVASIGAGVDIAKGFSAVSAAQNAIAAAIPGTTQWTAGVKALGNAWSQIPTALQPAVAGINRMMQGFGKSPMATEIQGFLGAQVGTIGKLLSGGGNTFAPLILATQRAIDTVESMFQHAMGSGTLTALVGSLAKMVGPATVELMQMAGALVHLAAGFARAVQGGRGMQAVVTILRSLAGIVNSSLFGGFIAGWVDFDRIISTVLGLIFKLISTLANLGVNLRGIGTVLGFAASAILTVKSALFLLGKAGIGSAESLSTFGATVSSLALKAAGVGLIAVGITGLAGNIATLLHTSNPLETMFSKVGNLLGFVSNKAGQSISTIHGYRVQLSAAIPITQHLSAAMDLLVRSEQSIGASIGGLANGFQKWTMTAATAAPTATTVASAFNAVQASVTKATDSVNALIGTLQAKNQNLASWAADAQILIKRGMDPAAVAALAQSAPQDLASMVKGTTSQLQNMNVQWAQQMMLAQMSGQKGVQGLISAITQGIAHGTPTTRAAATALATQLGKAINVPFTGSLQSVQQIGKALQTIPTSALQALAGKTTMFGSAALDASKKTQTLKQHSTSLLSMLPSLAMNIGMVGMGVKLLGGSFGSLVAANPMVFAVIGAVALLGVAVYELVTHWTTVWNKVKQVAADVWGWLRAHIMEIGVAVTLLFPTLGMLIIVIAEVAQHWRAIWNGILAFTRGVASVFTSVFHKLVSVGAIRAAFGIVKAIFVTDLHFIALVWKVTWDLVAGIFKSVWAVIEGVARAAWDFVAGIVKIGIALVTGIVRVGADLLEGHWSAAWHAVEGTARTIWNDVKGMASSIWNAIKGMLVAIWENIRSAGIAIWNALASFLTSTWNTVRGAVAGVWNAIKGIFVTAWNAIGVVVRVAVNGLSSFLSGAWNGIKSAATTIWNDIVSFFSQLPGRMVAIGAQIVDGLIRGIESGAGKVIGAVKHIGSSILGGIKKVLGIFSPSRETHVMGVQLMQGLSLGMQTGSQNSIAMQSVAKLLTTLRALISTFIPIFKSLGMQLMQGLSAGIAAGTGAVIAAAATAARAAVAAAKAATGTASPSKVFAQVAQFWMDGLALGIRSNMGVAQGAMEQAVTGMIPHGALPGMGGMGGMAGGSITISAPVTVTVAGTASTPHAIGGAVQQAVRQELTQVVRRLRAGAF